MLLQYQTIIDILNAIFQKALIIFEEKITYQKLKYNIIRETAKISPLSSGNTEKH